MISVNIPIISIYIGLKSAIKKISEMIDDDLNDAVEERFEPFKKDIVAKIRSHNWNRRKWAIGKLEKVKEVLPSIEYGVWPLAIS